MLNSSDSIATFVGFFFPSTVDSLLMDTSVKLTPSVGPCLERVDCMAFKVAEHSFAVCEYMSFAKSWQEKGYSSQVETCQVKNILIDR